MNKEILITTEMIKLDAFLKWAGAVTSGAEGKQKVLSKLVKVNGEICEMRGKKLYDGAQVTYDGITYLVKKEG